ncbi:hypothetical protein DPMN_164494 [Dreissena polymorpha]|uniref:Uncharacterized protein n=1 Tax=Dreissena polymorpha TaxID=45954 RepID=A0A9D4EUC0_DREPO|nr:hypothetical protein DPMN_164494 [Dreissena polymorpha]
MADGSSEDLLDSCNYVKSVMCGTNTPRVFLNPTKGQTRTGYASTRKRHRSDSNILDIDSMTMGKKSRSDENKISPSESYLTQARRSLYGDTQSKTITNDTSKSGSTHPHSEQAVYTLPGLEIIAKLSDEVSTLSSNLNTRIDKLETSLE